MSFADRPIAKAICAKAIAKDVCYWIAHFHTNIDAKPGKTKEPSKEVLAAYTEKVGPAVAEQMIRHLDAYDQRA